MKNQSNKKNLPISGSYTTAEVARMLNISCPTAVAFLKDSSFRLLTTTLYSVIPTADQWKVL